MAKRIRHRCAFVPCLRVQTILDGSTRKTLSSRHSLSRRGRNALRACQSAEEAPTTRRMPWDSRGSRRDTIADGARQPSRHYDDDNYVVQVHGSISDFSSSEWDQLARGGSASPFLVHAFLRTLEESGCACEAAGWIPRHVSLRDVDERLVAVAPAYLKTHSLGEFVFDQQWAEASYGAGIAYYPKLLLAVPFTPATGRRVLTSRRVDENGGRLKMLDVFAKALVRACDALGVGSVHVNFCEDDEAYVLERAGFMRRKGTQYHFANSKKNGTGAVGEKYRNFEDYLAEFRAKKRGNIRRERKAVREKSGLRIEVVRGAEIDVAMMDDMFAIYKATIDKMFWGRQYLNRQFFRMLAECKEFRERLCLVLARRICDGRVIAGTFNVVGEKNGPFYGRYWGCLEEHRYLHFETCYYAAIEYCIENGLTRMEPGAGGGDFKYMRGFEPSVTLSMHYIRDRRLGNAVRRFLEMETEHVDIIVTEMINHSAIRAKEKRLDM